MKTCKRCGQPKPIDDFTIDVRYKDGRYPWCAECRHAWRQGRKDRQRELHANWVEQNRNHVRQQSRDWYYEHRDQELVKRRERQRERWHSDPRYRAMKNAFKRERYHSNPAFNQKKRDWAVASSHRRRARIAMNGGFYSVAQWRALCEQFDHRCLCCNEQKRLYPDHVVPISRGGSSDISNIQPLCYDCNMRKGTQTIDYRPGRGGD